MKHVAETMHQNLEDLYVKIGWPLYRKYGHAYDAFKRAITYAVFFLFVVCACVSSFFFFFFFRNSRAHSSLHADAHRNPDEIFEGMDLSPELREAFLKNIRRRLSPQPLKLRADLEVLTV
jgi:translation initiation factor 2 subunit 1